MYAGVHIKGSFQESFSSPKAIVAAQGLCLCDTGMKKCVYDIDAASRSRRLDEIWGSRSNAKKRMRRPDILQ